MWTSEENSFTGECEALECGICPFLVYNPHKRLIMNIYEWQCKSVKCHLEMTLGLPSNPMFERSVKTEFRMWISIVSWFIGCDA
jgi:hypothetical protein